MIEQTKSVGHDVAADAEKLRRLHVPGDPLVLANVWDPTSARVVEAAGMRAIATASNALAPVNGYEDHGHLPPDVAFGALRCIADAVKLPVTADLEDGYGLSPEDFVDRLASAGACGALIEDTDHRVGALVDAERNAERIAAIKAAGRARGFDPVINARIDVHFHKAPVPGSTWMLMLIASTRSSSLTHRRYGSTSPSARRMSFMVRKRSRWVSSLGLVRRGSASVRSCSVSC